MKYSNTPIPLRAEKISYIKERLRELSRLCEEAELRVLRYLMFTNAGGATAVMGFMGASGKVRSLIGVKVALICFVFGLIIVGFLVALGFFHLKTILDDWDVGVVRYYNDKISWDELNKRVEGTEKNPLIVLLAFCSFGCFVLGVIICFNSIMLFS